jgi:S1-C subfamily serine protease
MRARAVAAVATIAVAAVAGVLLLTGGGGEEERASGRPAASRPDPESQQPGVPRHVVRAARSGTVYIQAEALDRKAIGSGVLLNARHGRVLTNFHVVAVGGGIQAGSPRRLRPARVRAAAPCADLALLEVPGMGRRQAIRLGRQRRVAAGDPVIALGYPVGRSGRARLTASAGVVSVPRTRLNARAPNQPRYTNLVQTSARLAPGSSGGPLVGADGRLVGIDTVLIAGPGQQAQGYAIGVDRIRAALPGLLRGRSRAWFGAGVFTPSRGFLRREHLPAGLLLTGVEPGTPAAAFGLENSLLTAIDGRRVGRSLARYCSALDGRRSGDTVTLTVIRTAGGLEETVRLKLE